ncbi:MAG: SMI1/KNR4 family protein [Novosphingobium sp.]|uniref:SMI1/KNR4 family protein n=1 Tax=Novosphingobium sp. TaxID=1874826 RepID=UPI0030190163
MQSHLVLQNWWSLTGTVITTRTCSEAEIAALEQRYGVTLPDDFRNYLRESAPVAENCDEEDGKWWPIERIRNIPDEYEHEVGAALARNAAQHLFFVDFSIWCWAWAISCANDETRGKIAVIGGGGSADGYVADSFAEFVQKYTEEWTSISQVHKTGPGQKAGPIDRILRWISRA